MWQLTQSLAGVGFQRSNSKSGNKVWPTTWGH